MDGESLARFVLAQLIDKYENSESFRRREPSQRRIQARLTDALVPGYMSGSLDPDVRHDLHAALNQLEECGYMELKWAPFEQDNVLDRVYLLWDALDEVYAYLGRISRQDEINGLIGEMDEWLRNLRDCGLTADWQWVDTWVTEVRAAAKSRGRIPSNLIPADTETRRLLQRAVAGLIDKGDFSLPIRLFSKRYLGHSKLFEREIQSHVARLFRRYWSMNHPLDPEAPDDDAVLLRELGIEVGHEDVTFCGTICFHYDGQTIDVDASVFPYGLSIDASDVRSIHITRMSASRILTIENKANYRAYVRDGRRSDELVIYLGGFASPAQREFLRQLRSFVKLSGYPSPQFLHWGDLDYGGILILQHLRHTCWPEVAPWRMEPELLAMHANHIEAFDPAYRAKLERLLDSQEYEWAYSLINGILDVGGTLEQEALLV